RRHRRERGRRGLSSSCVGSPVVGNERPHARLPGAEAVKHFLDMIVGYWPRQRSEKPSSKSTAKPRRARSLLGLSGAEPQARWLRSDQQTNLRGLRGFAVEVKLPFENT